MPKKDKPLCNNTDQCEMLCLSNSPKFSISSGIFWLQSNKSLFQFSKIFDLLHFARHHEKCKQDVWKSLEYKVQHDQFVWQLIEHKQSTLEIQEKEKVL